MLFLARWARLSWKETAEAFRTSWDKVLDAVEHVVTCGLKHRTLGQIDAIGIDEIQYAKGHTYLTLVYQIDIGITRLLWAGRERTLESFHVHGISTGARMVGAAIVSNVTLLSAGQARVGDFFDALHGQSNCPKICWRARAIDIRCDHARRRSRR